MVLINICRFEMKRRKYFFSSIKKNNLFIVFFNQKIKVN